MQHGIEVEAGERFKFGENWSKFLRVIDDRRIAEAVTSLQSFLQVESLAGQRFLDVGSGSGLFSLAARRLGASVYSFDFDPQSVACALELRSRYFPGDPDWQIAEGSVLDPDYLLELGQFDVLYSWGVLHHTGDMWKALGNVAPLVKPDGRLFIAIYNDQGRASRHWLTVKQIYCKSPQPIRGMVLFLAFLRLWGPTFIRDLVRLKPFSTWLNYVNSRGMSPWRDVVDWVGGLPFEVAKPEEIFDFYAKRGFSLRAMRTNAGGLGCNEYLFKNIGTDQSR